MTVKVSSNNTLYSAERAANLAGISEVTLRTWLDDSEYKGPQPSYFINGKRPVFAPEDVEQLRKYVHSK